MNHFSAGANEDTIGDLEDDNNLNASWSTNNVQNAPLNRKKLKELLDGNKKKEKYLRLVHLVQL